MPAFRVIEFGLFGVQLIALLAVIGRMLNSGLYRVYRYFFLYLMVQTVQDLIPILVARSQTLYGILFIGTEGIILCFYALVVFELYHLVLKDLPGIASTAKRYIRAALVVSILGSLLLQSFEFFPSDYLPIFYGFERVIASSLLFFVVAITAFLVYYPVPLSRNLIFYTAGYTVYFTCKAAALFLRNSSHPPDRFLSFAVLCGSTICLIFWAVALRRRGEDKDIRMGPKWNGDDERRVIQQLEAINASLVRARK